MSVFPVLCFCFSPKINYQPHSSAKISSTKERLKTYKEKLETIHVHSCLLASGTIVYY